MIRFLRFFLIPLSLFSFTVDPWLTPIAEFELRPTYSYRYYPSVDRGTNPSSYHSHDQLINLNLGVNFWPNWDFQFQTDFSHTRKLNWGGERVGAQLRYLLLDDVAGDPVSLTLGGTLFYVPTRNLRDVSSPYHSQGNLEVGASVGKEIDNVFNWVWRYWGFLGLGIANRGYPWIRPIIAAEGKFHLHHVLKIFSEGYFGFGNQNRVDIDHFDGYASVRHHSIDIGMNYTYLFEIWGALGVQYAFRLYAHSFPQYASTFTIHYRFPFSLF
ncbi:MAG: hypothetical protein KDK76_04775 [Chlamydiia bacterium]|nr:hypothetical protein [Chlamydiia bacterium]